MFHYAAHKFVGGTSWVAKNYSNLSGHFSGRVCSSIHCVELYIHNVQQLFKEGYDNVTLTNNLAAWKKQRIAVAQKLNTFVFCGAAVQRGPWPRHSWGF
jgi:hypothetical protein